MQRNRRQKSGTRGITRLYAVQTLYEIQMSATENWNRILEEAASSAEVTITEDIVLTDVDKDFFRELIKTVLNNVDEIDKMISKYLSADWSLERLDKVLLAVLRLGTCELRFFRDIPPLAVFNEYIEIAKAFAQKSDVSFVNGVLNSISEEINKNIE